MPEKKSPWRRPTTDTWIKVGKRIVNNRGKHPRQSPVWVITNIETTGNGARMVHLKLESDPETKLARWASDLLGSAWFNNSLEVQWMPAPPPPRPPRPKPERKSRFEREAPV